MNILISSKQDFTSALYTNNYTSIKVFTLNTIGFSSFTVNEVEQTIEYIKKCRSLESINLIFNDSNIDESLADLMEALKWVINLTSLKIQFNYLKNPNKFCEQIQKDLKGLLALINFSVEIRNSSIKIEQIQKLISGINSNQKLKCLDLNFSSNQIDGHVIEHLIIPIAQINQIENLSLNLSNNNINEDNLQYSGALAFQSRITSLKLLLGQNSLRDNGAYTLSLFLAAMKQLKELTLSIESNDIGIQGISQLQNSIQKIQNLQSMMIQIGQNNLDADCLKIFGNGLQKLWHLSKLCINLQNSVNIHQGVVFMLEGLSRCQNIQYLNINLNNCSLCTDDICTIFNQVSKLNRIKQLGVKLENNYFDSKCIQIIGNSLKSLYFIKNLILNLDYNQIDSSFVKSLGQLIKQETNILNVCITSGDKNNKLSIQYFNDESKHTIFAF
ncbi:hypothetical protein ABPG72_002222 [Tetrahymena utriculariae]